MDPGSVVVSHRGCGCEIVEGAAVHVPGLDAHDRRASRRAGPHRAEVGRLARALIVGRHRFHDAGTESEQTQAPINRRVAFSARHHSHDWAADESLLLHVPPGLGQNVVARRGECNGVRALSSGDEAE